MSRLTGRLKRLEHALGLNGGPPCTCEGVGARDDLIGKLTKPGEGGNGNGHIGMPERAQCEATKHYWERENYRVRKPEPYVSALALCVLFEDEDIPFIEPNYAIDAMEYAMARDARLREEEAADQELIVEILAKEAVHEHSPAELAIIERINKLRPIGVDPSTDEDPEKWLKLPTDV